ncbi:hypothetical protein D7Z54_11220 [Salibacterium salarium]|uniref:Swarming motility protein SwrB n=1 Tax=Salibacterium salarium TaxID=284579 RepID=A0A428N404_9BACI|nr:hypothetical protein [Salibacterium salarium]RSL33193.1 hypothetical protein D7Z54_11220 [Salibacterium salarium]
MTIVLLVLSLGIHLFTFFILILFYQQIQKVKEERSELYGMREDMEELLSRYTDEMKRENKELKQYVDKGNFQLERRQSEPVSPHKNGSPESFTPYANETKQTTPETKEEGGQTDYIPPLSGDNDKVESSDQAKVLSLSSQGYARDDIAKELNIGKGEVDLFLKFYQ